MAKYFQHLSITLIAMFILVGCGSGVRTLEDTSPSPEEPAKPPAERRPQNDIPDNPGHRDDDPDADRTPDDSLSDRSYDPSLGTPGPLAFDLDNPCQSSPNYLCVVESMNWNIRVFDSQLAQLHFAKNIDTAQEYRIYTQFSSTAVSFKVENTQQLAGVSGRYHTIYYGYPAAIGAQLIASASPVMIRLHNVVSSFGRFARQSQHVEVGIVQRQGHNCAYKAIFYDANDNSTAMAYVAGVAHCNNHSY